MTKFFVFSFKNVLITECSMPIEYCEYSQNVEKCQAWLERNLPELVEKQARIGGGEDGGLAKGEGAEEPKKHQA